MTQIFATNTYGINEHELTRILGTAFSSPKGGDGGGDLLFEDFDEVFVFVDDFLLGFDLRDDLLLITG